MDQKGAAGDKGVRACVYVGEAIPGSSIAYPYLHPVNYLPHVRVFKPGTRWCMQAQYRSRQEFAKSRVRVKGRFVSKVNSPHTHAMPFPLACQQITGPFTANPHLPYLPFTSSVLT